MGDAAPELHTARLTLRRIASGDAAAFSRIRSLPDVARYQWWTVVDRAEAERVVAEQVALAPDVPGTWFQLVIVDAASGAVVGDLALHVRPEDARQVELGVNLDPAHGGRGLATEAVTAVLGHLFDRLGKHRVMAITDADNRAAAALFTRLGFRREGHFVEHVWFKGAYGSEFQFALLKREWDARRSAPG